MITIIRATLRSASPGVRRMAWTVLAFWLLMLALQVWDSRNASGPAALAEFLGVLAGLSGVALLGLAHTLHRAMREAPADPASRRERERVLIALPSLGVWAGAALACATALMAMRIWISPDWGIGLAGALVYGALTILAAHVVAQAVGALYDFGQREAAQSRTNPHMVFNALNTVASLIRRDPVAAERAVETLGEVLRLGLDRSQTVLCTIQEELDYVRAFLALEQLRWGDALHIEWRIDARAVAHRVPAFLLQPLVENALKHGLAARTAGGVIVIGVDVAVPGLRLFVEDNGPGFGPGWMDGVGLSGIRQRLTMVYGAAARLVVHRTAPCRVTLELPMEPLS